MRVAAFTVKLSTSVLTYFLVGSGFHHGLLVVVVAVGGRQGVTGAGTQGFGGQVGFWNSSRVSPGSDYKNVLHLSLATYQVERSF